MSCTTLLVGRDASFDGSTMIARNDDSGSGKFTSKKCIVRLPEDQPRHYKSVLSGVEIDLPDNPMCYTCCPNTDLEEGIWAAAGINEENISMTATETITSNERVLGADPLVVKTDDHVGGIGEEDIVVLVLPYIHSAREGVERLGSLLETYGTYEMNGIAFQDKNEIWWLETIGGHHFIAKRVPDDHYVVMPNQQGIDSFDLDDALNDQVMHICSKDMGSFIRNNHLALTDGPVLHARLAFGSHTDADHCYNTPRAWYMLRYFNPHTVQWDGPDAEYTPLSDDLPWSMVPERKITVEDAKYILSSHYQGTPYDPYGRFGDLSEKGAYRPIGVNRTSFLSLHQIRNDVASPVAAVEWIAFGCNSFNAFVPFYTNVHSMPAYIAGTTNRVTSENFYWASRLIGCIADAHFSMCEPDIERYQMAVVSRAYAIMHRTEASVAANPSQTEELMASANEEIADMAKAETDKCLANVLYTGSMGMKNSYARSDG